ncbi:quinone oxidoreductase family protein [Dictyobacter arantiisoli]|uniref:NAD(P)H quinone oxidoreductase n=1 Tax=Dictyobacter arantiisoli TaxID=2014874 RepID=A0A5A5TB74_9CHLR|nr:zinc-binding dehydrogenase [Dictyobacter arantiisoli]GCF08263.1 NAD(P)H quinone oxidoreductase [Dictyobacter arantiisoli]
MKAVQFTSYGEPEVLQLREVADPVPTPHDVLIEVKATTVNHLDLFQRAGSRPVGQLPFTPGLEAAGVVIEDSNGFRAGEHVLTTRATKDTGSGGYASKLAVPAAHLARIPAGVSFAEAVAAGLAASTAWGSLFDLGHLKAGERALIWAGSSGVGSIAIQLAKQAGAWVATTASSEERAATLKKIGADLVINPRTQNVEEALQAVGGAHLVIELVGTSLQTSLSAATVDGRIILIGNLGGKEATIDTQAWRLKRLQVIGGGQLQTSIANEEKYLQLIAKKNVIPLIARILPIEQAAEAHRLLESGEPQGKLILTYAE